MFLTSGARQVITKLRQTYIEALILNHFNLKSYIYIKINTFDYAIDRILNQLTLNNLN